MRQWIRPCERPRSAPIEYDSPNPVPPPEPPEAPGTIPVQYPKRRMLEEPAPEFVPHMLAQLEDELARSRKREAFWISVILHIIFVLLIIFSPQLLPDWAQPHLLRAQDLSRGKETTFLALPQDAQRPTEKVKSDKLSDKNRIAQTRHPRIDRKTLEELRSQGDQRPPGAPETQPAPQTVPEAAAPPPPAAQPAPPPAEQETIKPQIALI